MTIVANCEYLTSIDAGVQSNHWKATYEANLLKQNILHILLLLVISHWMQCQSRLQLHIAIVYWLS
jgi:hypothetical protein